MKIRIEMTAAEMMSVGSICNIFADEPIVTNKKRLTEEFSEHTTDRSKWNEDGSYEYEFEASEIFSICVINWLRDIIGQTKSLILGAVDTYKNLSKMMGLKKLVIDGEQINNVCKKVRTKVCVEDMNMVITTHPHQDVSDEDEKRRVTEKVTAALKQPITE